MHIAEYWWGNLNNHDPLRERKLLLTKRELHKMERKVKETGLTIIVIKYSSMTGAWLKQR
jgi:SsrA-binding protein